MADIGLGLMVLMAPKGFNYGGDERIAKPRRSMEMEEMKRRKTREYNLMMRKTMINIDCD